MFRRIALILVICLCSITAVQAIGVGVSPANMTFDAHVGIGNTQSLFVKNDGSETANYRLYVDDEYIGWFDISPNNFTLEAGDFQEVEITVKPPITSTGDFDMKAYVIATSPSSEFEVGSGIKIPVHIKVSNTGLYIGMGVIMLVGVMSAAHLRRKRKGNDK